MGRFRIFECVTAADCIEAARDHYRGLVAVPDDGVPVGVVVRSHALRDLTMYEYENTRRVTYNFGPDIGRAVFVPVCPICSRYVKPGTVRASLGGLSDEPNATCKRHGKVRMVFEGFL